MFWVSLCMSLTTFAIMVLLDKMIDNTTIKKSEEVTKEDIKLVLAGIIADMSSIAMLIVLAFNINGSLHLIFTGVGLLIMNLYFLHRAKAKDKSTFIHAITMVLIVLVICLPIVDMLV